MVHYHHVMIAGLAAAAAAEHQGNQWRLASSNEPTLCLGLLPCLQDIPKTFGELCSLELLSIDTCMHITELPDSLTQLHSLTELRLHNAEAWPVQLPALPAGIGRLPKLRKLLLTSAHPPDDGSMPALPASLAASTSLQELQWGNLRLVPGQPAPGHEGPPEGVEL